MRPGTRAFNRLAKSVLCLFCLLPLAHLVMGALGWAGVSLGANPVEHIQDSLGIWGLRLLLLTLTITPLRHWTGWRWLIALRRMLGLFAFTYVFLHFLTYAVLDLGLDLTHLGEDILKRPFITIGALALLLLVPLAATSTNGMMRRLGRNWRRLHRLVYLVAILGVWHYYWQVKLDTLEPTVYAVFLGILLGSRWLRYRRHRAGHMRA